MSKSTTLEGVRPAAANAQSQTRRALIKSFGCQMNVYDSQRMADMAALDGYAEAGGVEDADLIDQHLPHPRKGVRENLVQTGGTWLRQRGVLVRGYGRLQLAARSPKSRVRRMWLK